MTCSRTLDVAPYLLGAISAGERRSLEQHLESCSTCRDEVIQLAGLPGLLWRAWVDGQLGRRNCGRSRKVAIRDHRNSR
jgi:anti-sigma factor RsiW